MRNATTTTARDARDTVLPVMRDAIHTARDKGAELLDSNAALEARRRGVAVIKAARGDTFIAKPARRFRFGLGMVVAGTGLGLGLAWVARRFFAAPEPYLHTMPTPSGTVTSEPSSNITATGTTSGAGTSGTTDDVDLRAGMRTTT